MGAAIHIVKEIRSIFVCIVKHDVGSNFKYESHDCSLFEFFDDNGPL